MVPPFFSVFLTFINKKLCHIKTIYKFANKYWKKLYKTYSSIILQNDVKCCETCSNVFKVEI